MSISLIEFGDHRDDLTREEFKKVAAAYDQITRRVAELLDAGENERARGVLLIDPWPLDPVTLAALRAQVAE